MFNRDSTNAISWKLQWKRTLKGVQRNEQWGRKREPCCRKMKMTLFNTQHIEGIDRDIHYAAAEPCTDRRGPSALMVNENF